MNESAAHIPSGPFEPDAAASRLRALPPGQGARDALADLIAASAHGDERAFGQLYAATSGTLFGIALRLLKRRDWAEEVLQESFVSVWRHAARYDRDKGAAMTWLMRIVRNQALDWIHPSRPDGFERTRAQPTELLDEDLLDAATESPAAGGAELLEYRRRSTGVAKCMAALDARQRQSLVLVFFHGLSHGDLALHLQQPLGTVKAWVRRGLARLAACLGAPI